MRRSYILLAGLMALGSCSSPILRKKDMNTFNQRVADKVFVIRKDIYPHFSDKSQRGAPLYKKGKRVRLILEQDDDWLRVRAFPAQDSKEWSEGKIILFIIEEFLEEKESKNYSLEHLQKELLSLLKEVKTDNADLRKKN